MAACCLNCFGRLVDPKKAFFSVTSRASEPVCHKTLPVQFREVMIIIQEGDLNADAEQCIAFVVDVMDRCGMFRLDNFIHINTFYFFRRSKKREM